MSSPCPHRKAKKGSSPRRSRTRRAPFPSWHRLHVSRENPDGTRRPQNFLPARSAGRSRGPAPQRDRSREAARASQPCSLFARRSLVPLLLPHASLRARRSSAPPALLWLVCRAQPCALCRRRPCWARKTARGSTRARSATPSSSRTRTTRMAYVACPTDQVY